MRIGAGKVKARGSRTKFADPAEFQRFQKGFSSKKCGQPVCLWTMSESRVLRFARETAADVDIAVFVEQRVFDKLLIDRFDGTNHERQRQGLLSGKPTRSWLKWPQT